MNLEKAITKVFEDAECCRKHTLYFSPFTTLLEAVLNEVEKYQSERIETGDY